MALTDGENVQNLNEFTIFDITYPLPYSEWGNKTKDGILMAATVLFAQKGYAAVSMKEIAEAVKVQPASLYNHFSSKEALWRAVLDHARDLLILFFSHMEGKTRTAFSFAEVLQIIFEEPEKMRNHLTCYAFALIQAEQFRDDYAHEIFNDILLKYSIDFIKDRLDECVAKGFAPAFDTLTVAHMYAHNVLVSINISVQKLLGRAVPYEPGEMVRNLHRYILEVIGPKR